MIDTILFVHGLESGFNGKKAQHMKTLVDNVIAPDLQVSLYDVRKPNSIIRSCVTNFFTNPLSIFTTLKQDALMRSLNNCTYIVDQEIKKNRNINKNDTLLCGSSWGGAVALNLIAKGLWSGKVLLFAPAFSLCVRDEEIKQSMYSSIKNQIINNNMLITIVHARNDDVIQLNEILDLCEKIGLERRNLIIAEDDNHSLNNFLIEHNELKNILKRYD